MLKAFSRSFLLHVFILFIFFCCLAGNLRAQTSPIVFSSNAGYCWYQDERAIIDNNQLIFTSVPYPSGDNDVVTYNLTSGVTSTFVLHSALDADDHSAAALIVRPDGRIEAVYCTHGNDRYVRDRITTNPGDTSSWGTETTYLANQRCTGQRIPTCTGSAALAQLTTFFAGQAYNPNVLVSTNDGTTWSYAGRLVRTSSAGTRPYAKYASNGIDKVWFTYTDGHPDEVTISNIYVAYLQGTNIYSSYGTLIGTLSSSGGIAPSAGTKVFTCRFE